MPLPSTNPSSWPASSIDLAQRRVSWLGAILAAIAAIAAGVRTVGVVAVGSWADLGVIDHSLGLIGIAIPIGMWLSTRSISPSLRLVQQVEAFGLVGWSTWALFYGRTANGAALGYVLSHIHTAELSPDVHASMAVLVQHFTGATLTLALTLVFVLRASIVPSTARRTAVLTGVVLLPLLLSLGLGLASSSFDPTVQARTGVVARVALSGFTIGWWVLVTAVCTILSKIVFDLRRQIRAAEKLGQYTLAEKIGEGGMGEVYRAHHGMMRRPTAIKLLPPERAGEANLERFEREVQLTAKLSHPNTITIYDYGRTPQGVLYYAMELLDGITLDELVARHGPQPIERVVQVMEQVADALSEAHEVGLVHRDVKPSNIFLCALGGHLDVPKVLDFGLVKHIHPRPDERLTADDVVTGTPQYLAPEAIVSPHEVDARGDLYALGAVAYTLLTGWEVFEGRSVVEVCAHHLHTEPVSPSLRRGEPIPPQLEQLVMDCLAKDPEQRPESAREIVQVLQEIKRLYGMSWTDEQAHAWWAQHGGAPPALTPSQADTGRTVTVCLHRTTPTLRGDVTLPSLAMATE